MVDHDPHVLIERQKLEAAYADALAALGSIGLTPSIDMFGGLFCIHSPIPEIDGAPAYLLLSDSDGLTLDAEERGEWRAGIYAVHDGVHDPCDEFDGCGPSAVDAATAALARLMG